MAVAKHISPYKNQNQKAVQKPDLKLVNLSQSHVKVSDRLAKSPVRSKEAKKEKTLQITLAKILKSALVITTAVVIMILISGLLVAGYFYMSNSDYFMVKPETITVRGLNRVSREEVLTAAGLDQSFNFLTLDVATALRSLKSLPWVERAELSRSFPDGINLEITEYKAKAIVTLDHLYYIDEKGRPFKKLDPGENPDLPIISGFAIDDLLSGSPLVLEGLGEVFSLMEHLSARHDEFRLANIAEFNHDPDRGVTIFTKGGQLEIRVGNGAFAAKLNRLGRVTAHLKLTDRLKKLRYLDLDNPLKVIGRLETFGVEKPAT
ncbi:MAG: FtsQ-type POTRA domain-containing protein [Deltaproteobacteria bacterium]|nr:FtsQ-type POTRA domain-containing protein [Deltaproteobacteria bacterium]